MGKFEKMPVRSPPRITPANAPNAARKKDSKKKTFTISPRVMPRHPIIPISFIRSCMIITTVLMIRKLATIKKTKKIIEYTGVTILIIATQKLSCHSEAI